MKILRENSFPFTFPMKVTCKQVKDEYGFSYGNSIEFCGSELEIEEIDIKKHGWFKYPDYGGIDYGVVCPVCGKFIVIDKDLLPTSVKENTEEIYLCQIVRDDDGRYKITVNC